MNPWNVGFLIFAWLLVGVAAAGVFFGEPLIAVPAIGFNTVLLTAVIAGYDRAEGRALGGERE